MKFDSNETKIKIFEAAVELFSTKGYSGTSMRDIARSVGIKESSIYNHFKGKRAILDKILTYYIESLQNALPGKEQMESFSENYTDPAELWVAGIFDFMNRLPAQWDKISLILLNEMFLDEKCRTFVLNTVFKLQKEITQFLLEDLYNKAMIACHDFSSIAEQYVYMMHGLNIESRLSLLQGENPDRLQEQMTTIMKQFINQLK